MTAAAAAGARVARIFLRPGARIPVREVAEVEAVAGVGLAGDHAGGGKRQVTLLSSEAWAEACRELGAQLDPGARRANLLLEGVALADSRGRLLRVGEALVEVAGETRPCGLMDDAHLGLKDALGPGWRGGVYALIREGGRIARGDPVVEVPYQGSSSPS